MLFKFPLKEPQKYADQEPAIDEINKMAFHIHAIQCEVDTNAFRILSRHYKADTNTRQCCQHEGQVNLDLRLAVE